MTRIGSIFLLAAVAFTFGNCSSAQSVGKSVNKTSDSFDSQAHRGGRGLMPENTIAAMLKAIDLGVVTLEMDAVITSDRKVILSHEPYFNPETTTAPDGRQITRENRDSFTIFAMSYSDIKKFDVGLKPLPAFPKQQKVAAIKPLLGDVIDAVESYTAANKKRPMHYNIETKSSRPGDNKLHPAPEEFVDLIMQVVNDKKIADRTIIQSFDFRTLQVMHQKFPHVRLAALVSAPKSVAEYIKDLGFTPAIFSPNFNIVNAAMIEECHKLNMKIIPWTVNEKAKINSLKSMGVDGIISDYPDLF
jgi:glycerophosphoryl diester phosphodiesterase